MPANSFGSRFFVTTFGESHGPALGVVIDGCPAGVRFDEATLRRELERRRPGGKWVSSRQEPDEPEVLSGVYEGRTLGTPIAMMVRNRDARSSDYQSLPSRPGHADDLWTSKFGHSDPRGGGRASGRETVSRVLAGAVARMLIAEWVPALKIDGFASQIGPFTLTDQELEAATGAAADAAPARFPSSGQEKAVAEFLEAAKQEGRSYGGMAVIRVSGVPRGLGQPVFHKLKADIASAFLGVGATCGIEIGEGFASTNDEGTEFHSGRSANYGGIRGGISTGDSIDVRVAFKPTSSVLDVAKKGRHDPCIVPRAIPVLEAMLAIVLADHLLWARTDRISFVEGSSP